MHDFETYRPLLFALAYRLTGSGVEADDILQDAYVSLATAAPGEVTDPRAYLLAAVTRLSLARLDELRWQREDYLGPWLPEPLLTAGVDEGAPLALRYLAALDDLSPPQRAAVALHEVTGATDEEVAAITGGSAAEAALLYEQAMQRLAPARPAGQTNPRQQRPLVEAFLAAVLKGDERVLRELLAPDVTYWSDAGGKVVAATRPVRGQEDVTRLLLGLLRQAPRGATFSFEEINEGPALVCWLGGDLLNVVAFDVAGGRIQALRALLNPDKLTYLRHQMRLRDAPPARRPL